MSIPFENNKGEQIHFSPELTIEDLVKMGVIGIRLAKVDDPLPEGWWRDCEGLHKGPNVELSGSPAPDPGSES